MEYKFNGYRHAIIAKNRYSCRFVDDNKDNYRVVVYTKDDFINPVIPANLNKKQINVLFKLGVLEYVFKNQGEIDREMERNQWMNTSIHHFVKTDYSMNVRLHKVIYKSPRYVDKEYDLLTSERVDKPVLPSELNYAQICALFNGHIFGSQDEIDYVVKFS